MTAGGLPASLPLPAVLSPGRDEAREWAERELSDPVYAAAEPTLLDRIAQAVSDFFEDLFSTELPDALGPTFAIVVAIVVTVLIVAGVLIWGRPRASSRSRRAPELFGQAEARTAEQLRRDAAAAAASADWDEAIVLRFRALVRGLEERTLVDVTAGTTVHGFARAATRAFPQETGRLDAAAAHFDDVRYLRRPGTEDVYRSVVRLDEDLTSSRPALAEAK